MECNNLVLVSNSAQNIMINQCTNVCIECMIMTPTAASCCACQLSAENLCVLAGTESKKQLQTFNKAGVIYTAQASQYALL